MELVTGKGATDHVSSADMASLYRGLLIADDAVLDTGDKLACTMLDANTAEIGTGDCMLQAHHARVEVAEQLTVRSGSQGFNRNDLIVARYTLGDNNVQAVYLAVIEGTAVAGTASDPAYAEGDIDGGDTLVEFPIWRIPISGVNVGTPERIMPTVDTLQSQITRVRESVAQKYLGSVNGTTAFPLNLDDFNELFIAVQYVYGSAQTIFQWQTSLVKSQIEPLGPTGYHFIRLGDISSTCIIGVTSSLVVLNTLLFKPNSSTPAEDVINSATTYFYAR